MATELVPSLFDISVLNNPILLLTIFLVGCIYWFGTHNFSVLKKLNVPGPKPWPYIGNLLDVKKYGGAHMLQLEYMKKYGKVFSVCFGRKPTLMIADPFIAKQIMVKEFANFRNRPKIIPAPPPLDTNLLSARDDRWKKLRITLSPSFSGAKMKQMVPLVKEALDTLAKKLESVADDGSTVDMQSWFAQLSLDIILSCAFGTLSNAQTESDNGFLREVNNIVKTSGLLRFSRILPFDKILRLFPLPDRFELFQTTARVVIAERRKQRVSQRKDVITLLLKAHEETTAEGVSKLSDDEVIANILVFLLAGHETTSGTLAGIFYYLSLYPDIQEKLHQEITDAIQSDPEKPLYDLIHSIQYLDCVVSETQRLFPVAFNPHREAIQSCTINGINIPAGTEIIFPLYALHHDPDAWPDPETFNPERFRGEENATRHPFQFMPFGGGPRACIGNKFALMEIKIVLVDILTKFKFHCCAATQVPLALNAGITLRARDGVHLKVTRR